MIGLLQRYHLSQLRKRCRERHFPPAIGEYLEQATLNPKRGQEWEPLRFIVLDTETTGLDTKRDHLLAFGAVSVQQRRIRLRDSLQLLVQAEVANRAEQVPLHGILPAESVHGVPERVAAAEILDYIGPAVLVGHHIDFDVRMIEKMIGAHLPGFFLYNRCLDTARLAQQLIYPNRPPAYVRPDEFTLDALIARYGLTEWDRHTAHGDAMIAAELLLHLLDEALARGRNRIGDICV